VAIGTPYTICQGTNSQSGTGSATLQVTVSVSTTTADAIVVGCSCDDGVVNGVSDSQNNHYAQAQKETAGTYDPYTYYALNTTALVAGTDTITITYSLAASDQAMTALGCSGIAHAGALDVAVASNTAGATTAVTTASSGTLASASEWVIATVASGPGGLAPSPSSWTGGFTPPAPQFLFGANDGSGFAGSASWGPQYAALQQDGVGYGFRGYGKANGSGVAGFPMAWNDGIEGFATYGTNATFYVFDWEPTISSVLAGLCDANIATWAQSCQQYVNVHGPGSLYVSLWHEEETHIAPSQVLLLHAHVYPIFVANCEMWITPGAQRCPYGQILVAESVTPASSKTHGAIYCLACPANTTLTTNLDFYGLDGYNQTGDSGARLATTAFNIADMRAVAPGCTVSVTEINVSVSAVSNPYNPTVPPPNGNGNCNPSAGNDDLAQFFSGALAQMLKYAPTGTSGYTPVFMTFFAGTTTDNKAWANGFETNGAPWVMAETALQAIATSSSGSQQNYAWTLGGVSPNGVPPPSFSLGPVLTMASAVVAATTAVTAGATLQAAAPYSTTLISLKALASGGGATATLAGEGAVTANASGGAGVTAALAGEGAVQAIAAGVPAYVIGTNAALGGGGLTLTVNVTQATTAGDGFLVGASCNIGTVTGVSDGVNSYTLATSTSTSPYVYAYVSTNTTALSLSGKVVVSYSTASAAKTAFVLGVPGAETIDQAVSASGTTATATVTTAALAQSTEAAVAVAANGNSGGAPTWAGSLLSLNGALHSGATQYSAAAAQGLTSTAAYTATADLTSDPWSIAVVTFTYAGGAGSLEITTPSLPGGTTGQDYSATISAQGGYPPYAFSIASGGPLPQGLNFDGATGAITGNPQYPAALATVFEVTDFLGDTATAYLPFLITSGPLAPPMPPVFPAGYGPYYEDFEGWIENTFGFLTSQIVFRAQQQTAQSLPAGQFTVISYDTVLEDPYGGWQAGSDSWQAPYSGWYLITVQHSYTGGAAISEAAVIVSGGTPYEMSEVTGSSLTEGGAGASLLTSLVGGADTVQGVAWINATLNTDVSAPGRYPSIEITFVSQ
jgi:hypothetical protein